jgi:hypothetical protein
MRARAAIPEHKLAARRLMPVPNFWTMNVHECPRCGSYLRYGGDAHFCEPHHGAHIRYNLATTEEEKAAVSESVRQVSGISEDFWYRNRPKVLAIVQRLRRDGHPDPKVMACIAPRSTDKPVRG